MNKRMRVAEALAKCADVDSFMREVVHEFFERFPHQNREYFVKGLANAMPQLNEIFPGRMTQKKFEAGIQVARSWVGTGRANRYTEDEYALADSLLRRPWLRHP